MTPRREQGSGSLVERPRGSGKWRLIVRDGVDEATGRPRRRSFTFHARGLDAARRRARELIVATDLAPAIAGVSVADVVTEYLSHLEARGGAPRTLAEHQRILSSTIAPAIGKVALEDLTPRHLDHLYRSLSQRGLSPASVRRYHALLSASLNQAVRWGWLMANPCLRATLPRERPRELSVPSPEDVSRVLQGCAEGVGSIAPHPLLGMLVRLAVVTGARRGELCALTWPDVDEERIRIGASVFTIKGELGIKEPKSGRSREVRISTSTSEDVEEWRAQRHKAALDAGVEVLEDGYVLSPELDGSAPWNPDTAGAAMRRLCD